MVAGLEAQPVERRRLARRPRLSAAFVAIMSVQCSSADDAICSACHIGYYGSGTSKCTKCEKMENCKYGCGHHDGVSCDGPGGEHIREECGECKEGFFEPYCDTCTVVEGCKADKMHCTT